MYKDKLPERLERKVIYESPWVSLYTDKVQMPSGEIIPEYHQIHYPGAAVSCVIFNEKKEILLIQSKRYTTGRLEWEVPAGGIEQNETPEDAARRECLEETGCTIKDVTFLCQQNPNNGISDLTVYVFGAMVDTEDMKFDEDEVKQKKWIPQDEVMSMLKENTIYCGVSILALLYAMEFYVRK